MYELNKTLIITRQDLTDYCGFSELLEAKAIEPYIFTVQYQYVKALLCPDLYSQILDEIASNTLSYENIDLIYGKSNEQFQGVLPYLCWLAFREYLTLSGARSTQSGLKIYKSETTEQPTPAQLDTIIRNVNDKVNFYRAEIMGFLEKNKEDYPLWNCDCGQKFNNNNLGINTIQDAKYDFNNLRIGVIKTYRR